MDENSAWLCTQAVASADDDHRPGDDKEKANRFGCIVLDIEADSDCYVLIEGDNTIGRHPLNSIYIEHPSVSMNHAVIQCDSDGVVLVDKGSLNKTRLNKKNLKKEVAYFLDENTSLMFGEVRANYYVDEKPSQNFNVSNNLAEQKAFENDEVSSPILSNKVITSNYSSEKNTKYNTLLINGNNSSCKKETVIPKTVIGPDFIKNTSNDVLNILNSSSPSDELLLEAISQVETMENDAHSSRMIHNISREDTPSPLMVLNELSLKPKNTLNLTKNDTVIRDREILSVFDLNESSDKVNPDVAREDTPSPLMDLECSLLDQHTNPNIISSSLLLSPNKINPDLTREDTPSPVMDLELNGYSSYSLSTSQTNNYCQYLVSECANKVNFEETQVSEVNKFVDTATHCSSTKNISNTNSTISKPTSLIKFSNTNDSDSLDECTQLPVWDHKDILPSKKVNSSISININDGLSKEEQKSNAPCAEIQSNDDDIFNCPTQKIIPSNTGVLGAKSSLISVESETNNYKFHDLKTQIINLDDHSSHKSLTSKLVGNSVSKIEKLNDSIFEADDDDILFCVAQEVESGEQSDKNLMDIGNVKHFDLKHNTNSTVKSKDSFCGKDVLNNDGIFYRSSQILSTSKSSHIKIEPNVDKQSSLKRNINTFEADDDDIFSSFIQQESNSQVHGLTSLNDNNVFNNPTQTKSILNNVILKTKASFTIHDKETQTILEHAQSNFSKQPNFFGHEEETQQMCGLSCGNKTDTNTTNIYEHMTQVPEMNRNGIFNSPSQKVSKEMHLKDTVALTINEEETEQISKITQNSIRSISQKYVTPVSALKIDDEDFFNCPTQKVLVPKNTNSKTKVSSTIHEDETQKPHPCTMHTASKGRMYEDLTQISKKNNEDFFNCSTQNVSFCKKINSKVPSFIHDNETQLPILGNSKSKDETSTSKLKTCAASINEKLSQNPELDDEDFFNCPTQKVSICKKINSKSPSIHDIENQLLILGNSKFKDETSTSKLKTCAASINEKLSQNPELDDEDFFNCPTQKVSICKKINSKSPSIHDIETQLPILCNSKSKDETSTSKFKTCAASINEKLSQNPELDDEDFFNCPTQKVSICKKINSKGPSIHDIETQLSISSNSKSEGETSMSKLKTYAANINGKLSQNPEQVAEEFFNCPTQNVSICKMINSKNASTIHDKETQILIPSNSKSKVETSTNKLKICAANINEKLSPNPELDDDNFFNCPTQKISICKKINSKVPSSIHDIETQLSIPSNSKSEGETSTSNIKTCAASINERLSQNPEQDDEDFFNCPTQKVSICKEINSEGPSIHDIDTQLPILCNLKSKDETSTSKFKTFAANVNKKSTQNSELDDENFFNCSTQKLSISEKINSIQGKKTMFPLQSNSKPKDLSCAINDEETQYLSEFVLLGKTNENTFDSSSNQKDLIVAPETSDEDFFNCPTQKLSISKKINLKDNVSSTIYKEEAQTILKVLEPNKTNLSMHNDLTQISKVDHENVFTHPTQKVKNSKNMSLNIFSVIPDEESQLSISNKSNNNMDTAKTCSMRILEDLTQILKTNDEDFFDCSSQKVSISKKMSTVEVSSVDKKESQAHLRISYLNNADLTISETCPNSLNKHSTSVSEMDSDNFFSCPTQKISNNTKISVDSGDQETSIGDINDAETQELSVQSNLINYNSKIKLESKKKVQTKENDVDCSTQKSNLTSNKSINTNETKICLDGGGKPLNSKSNYTSDKTEMLPLNYTLRECKSVNRNQIIKPDDNTNICMIRKSTRLDSFATNKLNANSSVICSENKNASKSPKVDKKPTIRVRKDLHSPSSVNKFPKNGNKLVKNIPPTSTKKEIDFSDCSETFSDGKNNVKMISVKQEPLTDDLLECQNKRHSKRMNETIFSPLNVNNVSTNSTSDLQLANCKPSTSSCSNDNVSKWQLFWNKKKMASQCKGNGTSTNKVVGKEDRYQTRAITRKENTMNLNRKRKQDCIDVNESNKRMCKNDGKQLLDTSFHGIPEVVVSFSYLRNRHLQEMKQFVDMTGGSVTEEITQCTVLVTDKIRCTMKILSAIARGCPIVDANWLKHSYTVKEFQDVGEFIIIDKDAERKYNFRLKESLARAQANRLLDGYTVLVTQSVKPGHKDMKVIITCAGGNYVINWPKTRVQKELIVTCKQDRLRWKPMWDNDKAMIIDEDTLVASIIRQKLSI